MINNKWLNGLFLLAIIFTVSSCGMKKGGGGLNLFTVDQDVALGKQVSGEIAADSKQFPILPEARNKEVYKYIRNMRDKILNTTAVKYKDKFAWEVKIIDADSTLNAFATPGGYIYVYTGLIKYLDSEDQLAGVMGHEIAHADRRHSTRQMTKIYGFQILSRALLGDQGALSQVMDGLLSLKFSRNHETEADNYSVTYLCETDYNAAGAAGFFEKIVASGSANPPQFMSTHPNPKNRVQNIHQKKATMGCKGTKTFKSEYDRIKSLL